MSSELKPCPFCGCSDVSIYTNGTNIDDYSYAVECDGCGCTLDTGFDSEERAIEEWNRRKEPERKKGKWIYDTERVWHDGGICAQYHCSECRFQIIGSLYNYCPFCGAEMTR